MKQNNCLLRTAINLFEQLDLPLMRTLQRNSGKHCKHKAKIHTDCTIPQINYLPSSCGEPASTTCQTMWKGLSSFKIKIERASRNAPIDEKHAMNYSVCWFHQFIIPTGPVNYIMQSHSAIKPTKWLPQSIETDAANGWCESVNQSAQYEEKSWTANPSLYAKARDQLHYIPSGKNRSRDLELYNISKHIPVKKEVRQITATIEYILILVKSFEGFFQPTRSTNRLWKSTGATIVLFLFATTLPETLRP